MKKKIKKRWLKDLRSGKFPQTRGCLVDDKGFCCLGVLAEQAFNAGIVTMHNGIYSAVKEPLDNSCTVLPEAVQEWAGLTEENPVLPGDTSLADKNDEGESFVTIADLIDEFL